MAAGAWLVYDYAIGRIGNGTITLNSSNFAIILVTSSYTPDLAAHDAWSDISANEVANGGGYTTGGKALTGITWTQTGSPASGAYTFDCNDVSWTNSTITARYAVIVRAAAPGSPTGTDIPLCYCLLDTTPANVSTTNGTFAINMNASGVFTIGR